MPFISKFGLILTIMFVTFVFIARFVFPFGDEPDYNYRSSALITQYYPWWTPYYWLENYLDLVDIPSQCNIQAGSLSIWAKVDSETCFVSFEQNLIRWFIVVFVSFPLLIALIFRKFFVSLAKIGGVRKSSVEWTMRLNAVGLALIFPSIIYYISVFSHEQFTLVLSLFVFLFWGTAYVIPILFLMYMVDFGNTLVVMFFIFSYYLVLTLSKKFHFKKILYIFLFLTLFILFFRNELLGLLSKIPAISNKIISMSSLLEERGLVEKYPVIFRPVITFMTGIFMTPSGVKVPFFYVIIVVYVFIKSKSSTFNDNQLAFFIASAFTVLSFVFLLPNYVFAKYYVFLIPFLIYSFIDFDGFKNMRLYIAISTSLVFLNLLLYRIS